MLSRLESLVLLGAEIPLPAVRRQIASAIDIIVQLGRLRDRSRRLLEITEVLNCTNNEIMLSQLYLFEEQGEENGRVTGEFVKVNDLCRTEKLKRAGIEL